MKHLLSILIFFSFMSVANAECISGNCSNGFGTYIFDDGEKRIGEFKNGILTGQGTIEWPEKSVFQGGKYTGEILNGFPVGFGTWYYSNGDIKEGNRPNSILIQGQGTHIIPNVGKYVGQFKNDVWHGLGKFTWLDGNIYIGEFNYGDFHGNGTYTTIDGNVMTGEWVKNTPVNYKEFRGDSGNSITIDSRPSVSEWLSIAQQGFDMMSGTSSTGSSASQTCFKTSEVKQAFNKICNYKCGLTTYTHNLGTGVGLCPSTIQR